MSQTAIQLRNVVFSYPGSTTPVLDGLTVTFSRGFTGVVGGNGTGKSTLLRLVNSDFEPDNGLIEGAEDVVYCEQRTDAPPAWLEAMLLDDDGATFALRGRLGIEDDFDTRWETLSHGERKRAQIGCALWQRPATLAVDEPTNHIDGKTRAQLLDALRRFNGIGLIVSHDRNLLDELCHQSVWLEPGFANVYPGGYSDALTLRNEEKGVAQRLRARAVKQRDSLVREKARRRADDAKADRQLSKGNIDAKDHDAKARVNLKKLTSSGAGKKTSQLDGRLERAQSAVTDARVTKEFELGIWLPGSVSRRQNLLSVAAGSLEIGNGRTLTYPDLFMRPTDRVAITGINGSGKSTLLRNLVTQLNVPPENTIYMPQEISAEASQRLLAEVKTLSKDLLGQVMTIVSRLGTRPGRLLESELASPGEIRKLLLALGMARSPHLLIMDEPTNHLDLPSIEALEHALKECPCGLLLVSHDQRFLDETTSVTWQLEQDKSGHAAVQITM